MIQQFWLQLGEVIRHVSPIELVDVAVVAFVLYQLLRLLRGTQGTQILVGLILLAVVGVISTTFNLILLSWLFRNATFFIVIAVIVIFQAELRRAFDQLGRIAPDALPGAGRGVDGPLRRARRRRHSGRGRPVRLPERDAHEPRHDDEPQGADPHVGTAPLHDGAVIVRGNRVVAAGCLLPLPEEGTVRERLGTRHRAALGLSLASDALVLVVSEETGNISVIEEGKISRNLDPDSLRRRVALKVASSNGNGIFRFRR